jgi:Family of unknown function (DUF6165)
VTPAQPCPRVPVSWGELLDKLTILEIKHQRIHDEPARGNVARELEWLLRASAAVRHRTAVATLHGRLRAVNEALWEIEDAIRHCEARANFGEEFIALARAVYRKNDERAAIKRQLNLLLGSELIEEKSYASAR